MKARVIDTNVLRAANADADHLEPACWAACAELLDRAAQFIVVLDDGFRILGEYLKRRRQREPGSGDRFVIWLLRNQADELACECVRITRRDGDREDYNEFHGDPALTHFDPSDRKFVAVAKASKHSPAIHVASDRGWKRHDDCLVRHGVRVEFLCAAAPSKRKKREADV